MSLRLRPLHETEIPQLLDLFRASIRQVAARDYAPEQIAAWSSDDLDAAAWGERFAGRFVVVAEIDGELAGFSDLAADGYLDRLFVSPDHQRRGVARALFAAIEGEARRRGLSRLRTDASLTARPFFATMGFRDQGRQTVTCRGVTLENHRMELRLENDACTS